MKRSDIEIMAPVGSYESLMAAIEAGADSIYFGVGKLNMRSQSSANFTLDDLGQIVSIAKEHGLKTYLTVNTVVYDEEVEDMHAVVQRAKSEGVDALIMSDQAAIMYAHSEGMEVHISTQLNVSNTETVRFFSQWADVVVLARELSLTQIDRIHKNIEKDNICGPRGEQVKIEMFAHGAMCMGISGKCYLSLHDNGCSANRGACRQICRHSYELHDRDTGAVIRTDGQYLLSPKDLCTIEFLDKFIEAGVRVLKIEGRARSSEYVKRVVGCYDEALKALEERTYTEEKKAAWVERLSTVFNRGFWGGYYLGKPVVELSKNYGSAATMRKVYVGKVTNVFKKIGVAEILVEAAPLEKGRNIFITGKTTGMVEFTADEIYVAENPTDRAPQGCYCSVKVPSLVHRGDKLYKEVPASEVETQ
ncbi:MAG: U32 family peptidase [Tidjanibacter sp.]|nr:U32 family peptidase [Tidjanibacter sp.]